MKPFLCIHGHFYQPPRENPWLEEIEAQESARPFHDWNERICAECYRPNACARILDGSGKILDIVNNYESISFNFGPTLLSWLATKAPDVYEAVVEADRQSLRRWGHGNALAQAYNHVILPLATPEDRETQIVWGIEDFRFRFGRDPEAMWLPETAINYATLAALHRHGMRFVILSPTQAERIRPIGSDTWHPVDNGTVDPRRAYRCFLPDEHGDTEPGRFLDVFFYDTMLASGISFGELLIDGEAFARRLHGAGGAGDDEPRLVHSAVDGETFGHHRQHGEMALAYGLRAARKRYGFELINYATFLERFPPRWEVAIKRGHNDEGTAWSCSHGVGRWKEDCGCRVAEHPEWNQRWRAPLRRAVDRLRDDLADLYRREAVHYFNDPIAARNAYSAVMLQRTDERVERFFREQGREGLGTADRTAALMLLEMQRHALLMQTSCGWFFNEISGIEATKILQYADRALQLAAALAPVDYETPFVETLAEAHSNIPAYGTGRDVFYRFVRPCRVSMQKVLNHSIITAAFSGNAVQSGTLYCYGVEPLEHHAQTAGDVTVRVGRARVVSHVTHEAHEFLYALAWQISGMCRTVIRRIVKGMDGSGTLREFCSHCSDGSERLFAVMQEFFGDEHFSLRDMFPDDRQRILQELLAKEIGSYGALYARMYDETRETVEAAISQGLVPPWEFRKAAENTLSKRLLHALERLRDGVHDGTDRAVIRTILTEARDYGYRLDLAPFLRMLQNILTEQFMLLREEFAGAHSDELQDVVAFVRAARTEELGDFLDFINSLPLAIDRTTPQNIIYRLLQEKLATLAKRGDAGSGAEQALRGILCRLAEQLDFSPDCTVLRGRTEGDD